MPIAESELADKAAIRATMRLRRRHYVAGLKDNLYSEWRAIAGHAFEHIRRLAPSSTIGSYCPAGSEVSPRPLEQSLQAAGRLLALPCIGNDWEGPLRFRRYQVGEALVLHERSRILEPLPTAPEIEPDVILVPLLATDSVGYRLGQGAGHYDRSLRSLRSRQQIWAVGLAYECQLIDKIPHDTWDEPLDAVVTPRGWQWLRDGSDR